LLESSRPGGDDLLVGQQLGNHLVVRRIARGGMGVVYEARPGRSASTAPLR
jgi:hypothetical protein